VHVAERENGLRALAPGLLERLVEHTRKDDLRSHDTIRNEDSIQGKGLDDDKDEGLRKARESKDEWEALGGVKICEEAIFPAVR
jgi:hypothetical protein